MTSPESAGRRTLSEGALDQHGSGEPGGRLVEPRRVDKPWGYELLWARTDLYVGKLLFVKAGEALSLQFHEEKDETLHLLSGSMEMEVGPGVHALRPCPLEEGQSIRIRPGTLHRITAVTDCRILEASTTERDDVVRIEDRYGRTGSPGDGPTPDGSDQR